MAEGSSAWGMVLIMIQLQVTETWSKTLAEKKEYIGLHKWHIQACFRFWQRWTQVCWPRPPSPVSPGVNLTLVRPTSWGRWPPASAGVHPSSLIPQWEQRASVPTAPAKSHWPDLGFCPFLTHWPWPGDVSSNWPGLHHSHVTKSTGKGSHRKVRGPLPKARDRQKQQMATNGRTEELNLRLSLPGSYSCPDSLKMRAGPLSHLIHPRYFTNYREQEYAVLFLISLPKCSTTCTYRI